MLRLLGIMFCTIRKKWIHHWIWKGKFNRTLEKFGLFFSFQKTLILAFEVFCAPTLACSVLTLFIALFFHFSLLLDTYLIPTQYVLGTYSIPTRYLLNTYSIPTRYLLDTYLIPTWYLLDTYLRSNIYSIPTQYLLSAYSVPIIYLPCTYCVVQ